MIPVAVRRPVHGDVRPQVAVEIRDRDHRTARPLDHGDIAGRSLLLTGPVHRHRVVGPERGGRGAEHRGIVEAVAREVGGDRHVAEHAPVQGERRRVVGRRVEDVPGPGARPEHGDVGTMVAVEVSGHRHVTRESPLEHARHSRTRCSRERCTTPPWSDGTRQDRRGRRHRSPWARARRRTSPNVSGAWFLMNHAPALPLTRRNTAPSVMPSPL